MFDAIEVSAGPQDTGVAEVVEVDPATCRRSVLRSTYDPAIRGGSAAAAVIESVGLFLNYLFANFQLRKVFAEIPEYNLSRFGVPKDVFQVEGRKSDFYWHDGRYWDEVAISTAAEEWSAFSSLFIERSSAK